VSAAEETDTGLVKAQEDLRSVKAHMSQRYPLLHLALNYMKTERGEKLSFGKWPYLAELYMTLHEGDGCDIMAASQCGKSLLMLGLHLERAGWSNKISVYVLPTSKKRDHFVQRRVNTLISSERVFRLKLSPPNDRRRRRRAASEKPPDSLSLKRFGEGTLMFLSAATGSDFVEFSADVIIIDEYDVCLEQPDGGRNVARAINRLRESPGGGQLIRFGNPEIDGEGITKLYQDGDQRRFHWNCEHCGHEQPIDWWGNVVTRVGGHTWELRDPENALPVCVSCSKPFRRQLRIDGKRACRWVPLAPESPRRSYHISRLDIRTQDYRGLFREFVEAQGNPKAEENFVNNVLGTGFKGAGRKLGPDDLIRCSVGTTMMEAWHDALGSSRVVAGIDVGSVMNVDIAIVEMREQPPDEQGYPQPAVRVRRTLYAGAVNTFDAVEELLRDYQVSMAVIDQGPERTKAAELRDTMAREGIPVWLCGFNPGNKVGTGPYAMVLKPTEQFVQVDRTGAFDAAFADIHNGRREFPADIGSVAGWMDQMQAPVRKLSDKGDRFIWTKTKEPDHYRLSDVYQRVAADLMDRGGGYYSS